MISNKVENHAFCEGRGSSTKSITVAVNGAFGKMGAMACQAIQDDARFSLVGQLGRNDSLAEFINSKKPQVVIDLTRADVVYKNAMVIIEHNAHPVIGASGLTQEEIATLKDLCDQKSLGGLIVPNFSIAVLLMIHFAKIAARFMSKAEIIEMHHAQKVDAPSGTAIKTAQEISKIIKDTLIPIHSLRLPGILAKQEVIFGSLGETLTVTHECIDRQSFMPGLLLACEKVLSLKTLQYGLEHVIDGFVKMK